MATGVTQVHSAENSVELLSMIERTSLHSTVTMKMAWDRELCSFMLVALETKLKEHQMHEMGHSKLFI